MKKFVISVDTQYDFMMPNGKLYVPGAEETIVPAIKFMHSFDKDKVEGILYTFDTHHEETYAQSEEAKSFPLHCVAGSAGWDNVFNVGQSNVMAYTLKKSVYDMWTDYVEIKRNDVKRSRSHFFALLADKVEEIILFGVATDICVSATAAGLINLGFKVLVVDELVRGIFKDAKTVVEELGPNAKLVSVNDDIFGKKFEDF